MTLKRIFAITMVGLLVFANLPMFPEFTITEQKSGRIVYARNLKNVNDFYISFIHSVNRTPVEEYYRISDNAFILYKTVFKSYGAGMPEYKEGTRFEIENGNIIISDIDTMLQEFSVFAGTVAKHKIVFNDGEIFLSEISAPQRLLNIKIKRLSLFGLIIYSIKGR